MATVTATAERTIGAPVDRVRAAVADYRTTRPSILTGHYRDYAVRSGGLGAGTDAEWKLAATPRRVRDVHVEVTQPTPGQLIERDMNSSMVTTWTVNPVGADSSSVTITTSWQGAGGISGFFEKTFAPKGLKRIYDTVLANLDHAVRS
ncbi:SRPBCC family protein [Pseudonocardia asaccharolytica]|uniref:Polyketide cyclase n=1 Tax=Pseudonocardia asaccharolytica DSM 44247 = NBRC 16224 TaxID=1123024 RepID=A0A511D2T6_9PSEU|nr:SRPBCC family protein [Pseudonocardia asaccharolytica]GEL17884.1 polyketide cyclase [Pseudonocardia asaccharolytica DSM 44247 = NBRC 16224]